MIGCHTIIIDNYRLFVLYLYCIGEGFTLVENRRSRCVILSPHVATLKTPCCASDLHRAGRAALGADGAGTRGHRGNGNECRMSFAITVNILLYYIILYRLYYIIGYISHTKIILCRILQSLTTFLVSWISWIHMNPRQISQMMSF